jgi:hypothetical protein
VFAERITAQTRHCRGIPNRVKIPCPPYDTAGSSDGSQDERASFGDLERGARIEERMLHVHNQKRGLMQRATVQPSIRACFVRREEVFGDGMG